MLISPRIAKLVDAYRENETPQQRGPRFKAVAEALEHEMSAGNVTESIVLQCLGAPNLHAEQDGKALFVYHFDHENAGRDGSEWYFHFSDQKLVSSGFNFRGINDLSMTTRWDSQKHP